GLVLASAPAARAWSTEGHMLTCQIAQDLLEPAAAQAVKNLLPEEAGGDLSAMCVWPDQVRHWYKYRWTSPLHFIDTPDKACTFDYARDCHDPSGAKDMCVAGAVANFTSQLMHYKQGSADRKYNLTEALLFLSHFMGDIHQPMHVGFTSDMGGNSVNLRWFKHKSNLHHVWDREIILTVLAERYGKDMAAFRKDLQHNITKGLVVRRVFMERLRGPHVLPNQVCHGEHRPGVQVGLRRRPRRRHTVRGLLRVEAPDRDAADRAGGSEAGHVPQPGLRRPQAPQPRRGCAGELGRGS
uniref:Aspergillus nuclease S1 n=1 Tax=Aegilops tauschii subsp. strangulata TaxID=200361 RepID=A0A453DAE3_AEGTS